MKELVEKLKHNKVAWIFLTPEEQKCIKEANETANVETLRSDGTWESIGKPWSVIDTANEIWRIAPDYHPEPEIWRIPPNDQPEPEYMEVEIMLQEVKHPFCVSGSWPLLGIVNMTTRKIVTELPKRRFSSINYDFIHLHCIPSIPTFEGVYEVSENREYVLGSIARNMARGKSFVARFRKK